MKQLQTDKYNIAWFKLAECVTRGEKEKALGVYRLLQHSIANRAVRHQLQGDLLLSFEEQQGAISEYKQAALMYQKNGQLNEAAAVFEHLHELEPNCQLYLQSLIGIYRELGFAKKQAQTLQKLFNCLVRKKMFAKAETLTRELETVLALPQQALAQQQLALAWLQEDKHNTHSIDHIAKALDAFALSGNEIAIQELLAQLKVINKVVHEQAQKLINT